MSYVQDTVFYFGYIPFPKSEIIILPLLPISLHKAKNKNVTYLIIPIATNWPTILNPPDYFAVEKDLRWASVQKTEQ